MPTQNASTTLNNWDFHTFHVQTDNKGGQFVSAETTLLAAGPPDITSTINQSATQGVSNSSMVSQQVYPMGVMENAGLSQSKQLQRIFEIGSSRAYFVPGRVVGSINWGRVFYHGVTLLRALYAYYTSSRYNVNPSQLNISYTPQASSAPPDLLVNPGFDGFWMSMFSDIFNQPTGNLLYFRDMTNRDVGSLYLEYLYIQGHQLSISSGSVLLMEGGSGQFDRVVPARMKLSTN